LDYHLSRLSALLTFLRVSRISPLWEAVLAGLIVLSLLWLPAIIQYSESLRLLDNELRRGLGNTAKASATGIDGDLHRTLHFAPREAMQGAAYIELYGKVRKLLLSEPDYTYVYTTIEKDGRYWFIVDGGDSSSADFSPLMDEYEKWQDNLAIQKAIREGSIVVSDEPYTDEWGTHLSAYAPILDDKGEMVAVLGIDMNLRQYLQRTKPLKVLLIQTLVGSICIAILIATLIWLARRRPEEL